MSEGPGTTHREDRPGEDGLEALVGSGTYNFWADMLSRLVPDRRTHRLSVVLAAMLQYSAHIAFEKHGAHPPEGSLSAAILSAFDWREAEAISGPLPGVVRQLFTDANVPYMRRSRKGEAYSLAEAAVKEYLQWHAMPWK